MTRFNWWGYLHVNGSIQVKRAWGGTVDQDMAEAQRSPMVVRVYGVVKATTRQQAIAILKEHLL